MCSSDVPGGASRQGKARREPNVQIDWNARTIDDEKIKFTPINVGEKLFDQSVFTRTPPNDSIIPIWKHEPDGHDSQVLIHVN
jgi:hypothetical protein